MESSGTVREIQDRQTQLSRRLAQLQQQLYKFEDQYLEATQIRGNVVRGWEGFLDFKPRSMHANVSLSNAKKENRKLRASDRIFSFSSISAPIPRYELDKDEDAGVALKWAEEYAQAIAKTPPEGEKGSASSTTTQPEKRQKRE